MVELYDLIANLVAQAVAVADAVLHGLYDLDAAGASNGMDPGPLVAGGGAASGAGGGSVAGGGSSDRGFRYSGSDGTVRDGPSGDGTVVGQAPTGLRLPYDRVVRDGSGNPTYYHVRPPGMRPGYIPAGNTSGTPPIYRPSGGSPLLSGDASHEARPIGSGASAGRG